MITAYSVWIKGQDQVILDDQSLALALHDTPWRVIAVVVGVMSACYCARCENDVRSHWSLPYQTFSIVLPVTTMRRQDLHSKLFLMAHCHGRVPDVRGSYAGSFQK
jgi:hypothetical protein